MDDTGEDAGFESFSEGFTAGYIQLAAEIAATVAALKEENTAFVGVINELLEPFDLGSDGNVYDMSGSCEYGERAWDAWQKRKTKV